MIISLVSRASASSFYLPLIFIINAVYVLIRVVYQWETFTRIQAILLSIVWALTAFAYRGIIEDHATPTSALKKKVKGGGSDPVAGGASLDLLGLVVAVQFGTCLLSDKFYWLLAILPFWGAYKGYQLIYGGENSLASMADSGSKVDSKPKEVDEATAERRKKRAEKRRVKVLR